jgi:head-tail adaptor
MQTETVTRLRATTTTDPYSEGTVEDWTTPTETALTTLAPAEPRPSDEPVTDARNAVVSGYTLYLPEATDVTAQDRMRVRGEVFHVLGDPAKWLGAGLVVQVGKTEG